MKQSRAFFVESSENDICSRGNSMSLLWKQDGYLTKLWQKQFGSSNCNELEIQREHQDLFFVLLI